jgi:hypothetical protein
MQSRFLSIGALVVVALASGCDAAKKVLPSTAERPVGASVETGARLKLVLAASGECQYGDYDLIEANLTKGTRQLWLTVEQISEDSRSNAPLLSRQVSLKDFDSLQEIELNVPKSPMDVGVFICALGKSKKKCSTVEPVDYERSAEVAHTGGSVKDQLYYFQYLALGDGKARFLDLKVEEPQIRADLEALTAPGRQPAAQKYVREYVWKMLERLGSVGLSAQATGKQSVAINLLKHTPSLCAETQTRVKKERDSAAARRQKLEATRSLWRQAPKINTR